MDHFIFRKAEKSDYDAILNLKKQVHAFHHGKRPDFYKKAEVPLDQIEFEKLIDANLTLIYVVELKGSVIGYAFTKAIAFPDDRQIQSHRRLFIEDLCIDQFHRNRRAGSFLMEQLAIRCKKEGYDFLDLNVWRFNHEAIEYYTKMGFGEYMVRMEKPIN